MTSSSGAENFMELATGAPVLGCGGALHVWPIGATEQHGPHLPNGTDVYILDGLKERVVDELGADLSTVWLPPLVFGNSTEHLGYPGTLSLSPETLMAVVDDVCSSLRASGVTGLALLNGHGGNVGVLTTMVREVRHRHGISTCLIRPMSRLGPARHGGIDMHAGELETSVMLALRPDLVHLDDLPTPAADADPPSGYAGSDLLPSLGWVTSDLTCDGVIGDATMASAEEGEELLRRMVKSTSAQLLAFGGLWSGSDRGR